MLNDFATFEEFGYGYNYIYALVFQLDFFNGSFDFHCLCVSFSAEPWLVDKRGGLRLPAGTEIETLRSQPANLKELLPEGGRGGVAVKCKRAMQALQMLSS